MALFSIMPQEKQKTTNAKSKKLADRNEQNKEKNKERMIEFVRLNEPDGLTTNELKEKMDCTRETIRRLGNELIKEKR